ncbi:nitronate monooxygenase, partial [Enterobacter hormaechei]|uniref:nitronate monooxygenase n=1 Tax=Enterobacter hormaechei TaxID=158836 RepID=UPI001952D506
SWASSSAALPLAVSEAGGLGVIAAGPMYLDALARTIDEVRAATDQPFAVNVPLYRQGADEVLDLLAQRRIPI